MRYLVRASFYVVNRDDPSLGRRIRYWFNNVVQGKRLDKHLRHRILMAHLLTREKKVSECDEFHGRYRKLYEIYRNLKVAVALFSPRRDPHLSLALLL